MLNSPQFTEQKSNCLISMLTVTELDQFTQLVQLSRDLFYTCKQIVKMASVRDPLD